MKKRYIFLIIFIIIMVIVNIVIDKNLSGTQNFRITGIMFGITFLVFAIVMLISFIEKWKKAQYSNSMVGYLGISLFFLHQFVVSMQFFATGKAKNIGELIQFLGLSSYKMVLITTPFMIISIIFFIIANIVLIKKEGLKLKNLLGIFFGFFWGLQRIVLLVIKNLNNERTVSPLVTSINTALVFVLMYFVYLFISVLICTYLSIKHVPKHNKRYIIILGCGLRKDGTLTKILKDRVDKAIEFSKEQYIQSGENIIFIPSGGKGNDEVISESEAMKRYLMEKGISEERILIENKSKSTNENFKYSKDVINNDGGGVAIFTTTNYHVFRSYICAKKNGLDIDGIASKTKWYFYSNAFLREFIGLISTCILQHIIVLVGIIVLYTLPVFFINYNY